MALVVEQRPEEELFVEENPTIYDTPYFTSRFNAANLPLIYKISNTKFPVNTEDVIEDILSVSNNSGFAQLVLDAATYTFVAKGTVEITNTTNYDGVWTIRQVIDANNIVISAPFVATETGNVQNYYNNYSTLVKVYSGLPEYHPLNSTKPMTLITDNPITVTPNSDNEAIVDVSALVKSKLSLKNEYDLNDIELFNAFYIEYSEQYDESDGTTVTVTTEAFQQDLIDGCDVGSANFVTNGDFATDLSDWNNITAGVSWVFDTGTAAVTLSSGSPSSTLLQQTALGITKGVEYSLSFDYDMGANTVNVLVFNGNVIYEQELTGTGTINVDFIASIANSISFGYVIKNTPPVGQVLRLDNIVVINKLTNPCLAYIFSSHSALQPQAKYAGNMGEYVQNFNSGVFANKWLTLMQQPVLFEGNYFDLSTIIPQAVIQSAIQAGGFFLQIIEFDQNGVVVGETNYPITQNLGDGIYRFRLDDKTFNTKTKKFTVQIIRIPVNLFVDGDQGTFDDNITGITSDIDSIIERDTTKSFSGAASLKTNSFFDSTASFITSVETTTTNETFTLPLVFNGNYNFLVNWGDGNVERITSFNQSEVTHTYSTAGVYDVNMNGVIEGYSFNNAGDKDKITKIKQWGGVNGVKFIGGGAFYGCSNLDVTATDLPNLTITNTLDNFFRNCTSLVFNSSIDNWDVSNIESMNATMRNCPAFNQPIGSWNVSSVTDMELMLSSTNIFNQNIGGWDVSNVTTMSEMFQGALVFNNGGSADIQNWNTISCTNFDRMFRVTSFDQPIGSWNVTSLTRAVSMFDGTTLSTVNYDDLLIGWESQAVQNNVSFDGGNSTYTSGGAAQTARTNLINDHSWSITDGGSV